MLPILSEHIKQKIVIENLPKLDHPSWANLSYQISSEISHFIQFGLILIHHNIKREIPRTLK